MCVCGYGVPCAGCRDAVSEMALHFLAKMKILVVTDIEREDIEFVTKVCIDLRTYIIYPPSVPPPINSPPSLPPPSPLPSDCELPANCQSGPLPSRAPWKCSAGGGSANGSQ